jgi:hypothetical protein
MKINEEYILRPEVTQADLDNHHIAATLTTIFKVYRPNLGCVNVTCSLSNIADPTLMWYVPRDYLQPRKGSLVADLTTFQRRILSC